MALNPASVPDQLHDALGSASGTQTPQIIECRSEEMAVAVAYGYARATNEPMLAIADPLAGSAGMGSARRDLLPMLVLGQEDLAGDFCKWSHRPATVAACGEALVRGWQVATADPMGPVYLCLDADLQRMPVQPELVARNVAFLGEATRAASAPQGLDRVIEALVQAERPAILADLVGRNPAAVPVLVGLSEALGAPVVDLGGRFNMPSVHPLNATNFSAEAMRSADVLLLLDVRDPLGVAVSSNTSTRLTELQHRAAAKVVSIGWSNQWVGGGQSSVCADVTVVADTAAALPLLLAEIRAYLRSHEEIRDRASERGAAWADAHRGERWRWRQQAAEAAGQFPLPLSAVAATVWEFIKEEDWSLVNGELGGWVRRLWDFRSFHQYLGGATAGEPSLGMGASIGAALASRAAHRLTVDLHDDSDLLAASGVLRTAGHHRLPILMVLRRGHPGHREDSGGEFAELARSLRVHGDGPISRVADLRKAFERAVQVVRAQGTPALVDVVCEAR